MSITKPIYSPQYLATQMAQMIGCDKRSYPMDHQSQKIVEVASAMIVLVVSYLAAAPLILISGTFASASLLIHASGVTPLDNPEQRENQLKKIKKLTLQEFQKLYSFSEVIRKDIFGLQDEKEAVRGKVGIELQKCWYEQDKLEKHAQTNVYKIVEEFVEKTRKEVGGDAEKPKVNQKQDKIASTETSTKAQERVLSETDTGNVDEAQEEIHEIEGEEAVNEEANVIRGQRSYISRINCPALHVPEKVSRIFTKFREYLPGFTGNRPDPAQAEGAENRLEVAVASSYSRWKICLPTACVALIAIAGIAYEKNLIKMLQTGELTDLQSPLLNVSGSLE